MNVRWLLVPVFVVVAGTALMIPQAPAREAALPAALTDPQFWQIVTDASEPGGYFRSANITNLTSNELWFQHVVPDLVARTTPGRVYLGVGPEQNFTYMTAVRPKLAVIFDIRRGNLDIQLMYKAMFELSKDRADFVSMLFAKPRPAGLSTTSTALELFRAFAQSPTSETLYTRNLAAIKDHLTKTHRFALREDDLQSIDEIYGTFYSSGFYLRSSPSYADLMVATDNQGMNRSYLASEDNYLFLKQLQASNLVVPVVGDFGGPKAIRAIGEVLKGYNATVAAFYLSNVEQYLIQDGKWLTFCRNVASLPLDASSTFIRSQNGGGGGFVSSLGRMQAETSECQGIGLR